MAVPLARAGKQGRRGRRAGGLTRIAHEISRSIKAEHLRIVFMGTPEFAVPTLAKIIGQGHLVTAVYTRAPRPGGRRGLELVPSPVHMAASRHGIEVITRERYAPRMRSRSCAISNPMSSLSRPMA